MPVFYPNFPHSILIGYLTDWEYLNSHSKNPNSYLAFYLSGIITTTCLSEWNDICVLWQGNVENCISECLTATFTSELSTWPTVSCAQKDILTPPHFVLFVTFYHKNRMKLSSRHFVQRHSLYSDRLVLYNARFHLGLIKNNFPPVYTSRLAQNFKAVTPFSVFIHLKRKDKHRGDRKFGTKLW